MSDNDSSDLSSVPSDVEKDLQLSNKDGILKFFSTVPKPSPPRRASTPPRKRDPSPPHEYVLGDNPDIAVRICLLISASRKALHAGNAWLTFVTVANAPFQQFIVMFRSRFTEAFPKSLPNFGPQELERDVVDTVPGEGAEHLLCALLGLLLNRKQDVKYVPLHSPPA